MKKRKIYKSFMDTSEFIIKSLRQNIYTSIMELNAEKNHNKNNTESCHNQKCEFKIYALDGSQTAK